MFRRLAAIPAALLGVLLAHETAYRIVAPSASHRHSLLEGTGHAWLSSWSMLVVLSVLALVGIAWTSASGRGRTPSLFQMAVVQFGAYATIEVTERIAAGHSPWPGLSLLLAGIAVQAPTVLITWLLLRVVLIPAAEKVVELLSASPLDALELSVLVPVPYVVAFTDQVVSPRSSRGPPSA